MQEEVSAAAVVLAKVIGQLKDLPDDKIKSLTTALKDIMEETFRNHWYKDNPLKGQGFRCIRVNGTTPIHPVLSKAAELAGLAPSQLKLPSEVSIWVDPKGVICKFGGDELGSTERRIVWENNKGELENNSETIDLTDLIDLLKFKKPFLSAKQAVSAALDEEDDLEEEIPSISGIPIPAISDFPTSGTYSPVPVPPHSNNSSPNMRHGSPSNHSSPSGRFHRGHRPRNSSGPPCNERFSSWQGSNGKSKYNGMHHGKGMNNYRHPQHPPWPRASNEMVKA